VDPFIAKQTKYNRFGNDTVLAAMETSSSSAHVEFGVRGFVDIAKHGVLILDDDRAFLASLPIQLQISNDLGDIITWGQSNCIKIYAIRQDDLQAYNMILEDEKKSMAKKFFLGSF